MQQRNDKIEGPFSIEEDVCVSGMITAGAFVRTGFVLELHGMICGDLTVEQGGRAIIHGTVNGTVWNHGNVIVYGTIDSLVNSTPECRTVIDSGALIRKRHP